MWATLWDKSRCEVSAREGSGEVLMSEGVLTTRVAVFGSASPSLETILDDLERTGEDAIGVVYCKNANELRDLVRDPDASAPPIALFLYDETETSADLTDLLNEVEVHSPLAVRAAVVGPTPKSSSVEAFAAEGLDRLLRIDRAKAEVLADIHLLLERFRALRRLRDQIYGKIGAHLFVTGANGFVGARLVREALRCTEARITALVRSRGGQSFRERLPLAHGSYADRLRLVEGDVTLPGLGLSEADRARIQDSVDEIWHLAALTDFSRDQRDAVMRINLGGTEEMLEFAAMLPHLRAFNHVSTAYVAGTHRYPDVVRERVEREPPEFKNPYEESKFLAEQRVVASGLPHFIYRPSVIFGESYSGRGDGKTVYGVAQVFRLAKMLSDREGRSENGPVLRVRARQDAMLNLIPVDWVVDQMLRLRAGCDATGTVFHITHGTPVSMRDMHDVIMPLCGIRRCDIDPALNPQGLHLSERFLYRKLAAFRPYMMESDPVFDRSNVEAVLGGEQPGIFNKQALAFALDAFFQLEDGNGSATSGAGAAKDSSAPGGQP